MLIAVILVLLGSSTTALANQEPPNWGPGNPPLCTDGRARGRVVREYNESELAIYGPTARRKIVSENNSKELWLGPIQPTGALKASNPNLKITARSCQADITLDNGDTETLYYRLDVIEEGGSKKPYVFYNHCSQRHDPLKDECKRLRGRN
jgi:hypothetical protein